MGLMSRESLMAWLFTPKLRLDPPTKIIRGGGTFCNRESFFIAAKRRLVEALGVGGKRRRAIYNNTSKAAKADVFRINFFILSELEINKIGWFAFDAANNRYKSKDEIKCISKPFIPTESECLQSVQFVPLRPFRNK